MASPIVALIYDFDKTLSPRNMPEYGYIPGINMEPEAFWDMCRRFAIDQRADSILSYMYMMLKFAKDDAKFTRETLTNMGKGIEFFPGVTTWFDRINNIGKEHGVTIEHYIISSGLYEIIKGSRIGDRFKAVFAAAFCYDENERPIWPATAVNYTSKTQYLFRINKGILDVTNDSDLNAYTPHYKRRIPFSNMIYIGDGFTDVPCMKMTKQRGGYSVVVHAPNDTNVSDDMLIQSRADFAVEANYESGCELETIMSYLFNRISANSELTDRRAKQLRRAYDRRGADVSREIDMRGGLSLEDSSEDME